MVGFWKEISKEGLLLLKNVSFFVGDGKRVRFWKDIWCGNIPFARPFPPCMIYRFLKTRG